MPFSHNAVSAIGDKSYADQRLTKRWCAGYFELPPEILRRNCRLNSIANFAELLI